MKMFGKTKEDLKVLSLLENGKWVKARGRVEYDRFMQVPELVMIPSDLNEVPAPPSRKDNATEKRVEFHLHTTMSTMDAVTPIDRYIKTAAPGAIKRLPLVIMAGCNVTLKRPRTQRNTGSKCCTASRPTL